MKQTVNETVDKIISTQRLWVTYLPFWISAILVSLISVAFAKIFAISEEASNSLIASHREYIFIVAPIGFILSWSVVEFFSKGSVGSGIPHLIAAIEVAKKNENLPGIKRLVGLKVIVAKLVGTVFCVLGGGSTGREGPTLQIAASVFDGVSNLYNKVMSQQKRAIHRQFILLAGGAAGLAAAFNTPLGGVVFAIEELSKDHVQKFRSILLQAVIIAGIGAQALAGSYLYLGKVVLPMMTLAMVIPVLITGALAGLFASLSTEIILKMIQWRAKQKSAKGRFAIVLGCALAFAAIVYWSGVSAMGSGRHLMEHYLMAGDTPEIWSEAFGRIVGNVLTFGSGIIGGVFAPALASGATLGALVSHVFSNIPFTILVTAGMAGFLSGVTRTPFTSAVLIAEMTGAGSEIMTFMLASFAGQIAARLISDHSFYDRASKRFVELAERESNDTVNPMGTPLQSR